MMKRNIFLLLILVLMAVMFAVSAVADGSNPVLYKEKDNCAEVGQIRDRLYELQYINGNFTPSNKYTAKLATTVKAFQKKNNLAETGKVDQATWDLLFSDQCLNAYDIVWNEMNNYMATKNYTLLGDEQFTVGADGNVIVFFLDTYSNSYFKEVMKIHPDVTQGLEDFVYYNNYDPRYLSTYPSLCFALTGYDWNNQVSIGQWFHDAWTSESCQNFYGKVMEQGYDPYMYSLSPTPVGIKYEAMAYFKNLVRNSDYDGEPTPGIYNEQFMVKAQEGLTVKPGKRFIIQHLYGLHYPYLINTKGVRSKSSSQIVAAEGWIAIVKAYIEQLKEAGVYDNSTIIITADHGSDLTHNLQCIFFIKEAGKKGTKMQQTNAPVTHFELIPTILANMGVAKEDLPGQTIYDYEEDEERERTHFLRTQAKEYGKKVRYNGRGYGLHTAYFGYTYTGDLKDLIKAKKRGPSIVIEAVQSFN